MNKTYKMSMYENRFLHDKAKFRVSQSGSYKTFGLNKILAGWTTALGTARDELTSLHL